MIKILSGKIDEIDKKETLRYLGYYSKNASFEGMEEVAKECEEQVLREQNLQACYNIYDIVWGQQLDLGFATTSSHSLAVSLEGSKKVILFACTAGVGIDRLIAKYSRISPARAVVIQAMGAALVEQWCDELCKRFTAEYGANKHRFSCGYGDLPLEFQRDIFTALSVTKHLGITLSENCFMTPTKSVTAIVGIK